MQPLIKAVLDSYLPLLLQCATGSTFPGIPYPNFSDGEELKVAELLGSLDDKIDLNRRTNETLEAMARAVFKSWFVDFDPVHAKAAGKAPAHMDAETAALFPDAFGEDGLPVGWATKKVSDLASHLKGTVKPYERSDDDFLHFSLPAYDANRWPVLEKGTDIKSNKTPVPEGVVLLSKLNPEVERVWLPPDLDKGTAICSTEFLVMAPAGPGSRSYIYSLFCSQRFRSQYQGLVTGTSKSHQRVQPKSLLQLPVVVAEETVMRAFDSLVEPMLKKTVANIHENKTLADLRDLLLPKLMSGDLRLRDAEKIVEGAA
jgi:type I restriction enzyme S subunit